MVAEASGKVRFGENKGRREVEILDENNECVGAYPVHYGSRLRVKEGDMVEIGDALTEGPLNPHDILENPGFAVSTKICSAGSTKGVSFPGGGYQRQAYRDYDPTDVEKGSN